MPTRPALSLVADEPDQMPRLRAFREQHPRIVIGTLGVGGAWQARIPQEHGEIVITRYLLGELLDKLGEVLSDPA
jgi:hypothetical protein